MTNLYDRFERGKENLRKLWKRYAAPPGPKELGRSKTGGLPSRRLGAEPSEYTWDDWRAEVRERFPVRYFLDEVVGDWVRFQFYCADQFVYRVKCTVLPSHHYHLIDLRKADPDGFYTHGYLPPRDVLLWTAFHALERYIQEGPVDPATQHSEEELRTHAKDEKHAYDEAQILYAWWTKGRKAEAEEANRLFAAFKALPKNSPEGKAAWQAWREVYESSEWKRPVEMLTRLAKIQPWLWTLGLVNQRTYYASDVIFALSKHFCDRVTDPSNSMSLPRLPGEEKESISWNVFLPFLRCSPRS